MKDLLKAYKKLMAQTDILEPVWMPIPLTLLNAFGISPEGQVMTDEAEQ